MNVCTAVKTDNPHHDLFGLLNTNSETSFDRNHSNVCRKLMLITVFLRINLQHRLRMLTFANE